MVWWIVAAGLALTAAGVIELLVPDFHLRAGEAAEVNVRRPPRVVPPPVTDDPDARTDYDVLRGEAVDEVGHTDILVWQKDRLDRLPADLVATFILFALALSALSLFLRRFGRGPARYARSHRVVLGSLLLFLALFKGFLLFVPASPYFFPLAALGFLFAHHLGRRAGITVMLAVAVVSACYLEMDLPFLAAVAAQGLVVGAYIQPTPRPRFLPFLTGGVLSAAAGAVALVAAMIAGGRVEMDTAWTFLFPHNPLAGVAVAGIGSALLAWALRVPAGMALGAVSRSRLLDLQDINNPVLKQIQEKTPGTWEHSRAMANLAEAAASHIGADGQLVRVGAYYHDFGKTLRPDFFIENVMSEPGAERPNPHKGLDPKDSADSIVEHVIASVGELRKSGVPEAVVEFAYTHHGTSVIEFFWGKCQEAGNPDGYTVDDFRYPGVKPQTRETGILMVVDAIEAASRTVDPPSREKFLAVVERIILSKLAQGQLDESGLSLEDIHRVMDNLVDSLVHARHERVRYPWQKGEQPPAKPAAPGTPPAAAETPAPKAEAPAAPPAETLAAPRPEAPAAPPEAPAAPPEAPAAPPAPPVAPVPLPSPAAAPVPAPAPTAAPAPAGAAPAQRPAVPAGGAERGRATAPMPAVPAPPARSGVAVPIPGGTPAAPSAPVTRQMPTLPRPSEPTTEK
jgi:putative nucleotidyltransferase with HDIG domain